MINGFDEETKPLTEDELALVPLFVRSLSTKIGKENAITNTEIRKRLKDKGIEVGSDPARIRKIINHIRLNKLVKNLLAGSNGYWVETDPERIEEYKMSLMQRATAILAIWKTY